MERELLVEQARQAAADAKPNLRMIRKHPEKVNEGKMKETVGYLSNLICLKKVEMKNAQHAGWTSLKSLKTLSLVIVSSILPKRKEDAK